MVRHARRRIRGTSTAMHHSDGLGRNKPRNWGLWDLSYLQQKDDWSLGFRRETALLLLENSSLQRPFKIWKVTANPWSLSIVHCPLSQAFLRDDRFRRFCYHLSRREYFLEHHLRRSDSWSGKKKTADAIPLQMDPRQRTFSTVSHGKWAFMRSASFVSVGQFSRPSQVIRWWSSWFKHWATTLPTAFSWPVMHIAGGALGSDSGASNPQFLSASASFPFNDFAIAGTSPAHFPQWPYTQKKWVTKPFRCCGQTFQGESTVFPVWSN